MNSVLFLGNSMLSSIKLAYDEIGNRIRPQCTFFCARGADLYFTKVVSGRIIPIGRADVCEEDFFRFFPEGGRSTSELYARTKRPLADVGTQFRNTGGAEEIELAGVDAIFYVAGVSPYDFVRLEERPAPISRSLRHELLLRMLDEKFLLREQLMDIRVQNPNCKHYFIGSPLLAAPNPSRPRDEISIVAANRAIIRSMAKNYLFDDVFMPDEELLDDSLMSTKQEYCIGGRQESELFQKVSSSKSDNSHMNKSYGRVVLEKFAERIISIPMIALNECP